MPRPPNPSRAPLEMPAFFAAALEGDPKAAAGFARLTPSGQREYVAWLTFAKRPETQAKRLAETLRAVAHGRKWAQRKDA